MQNSQRLWHFEILKMPHIKLAEGVEDLLPLLPRLCAEINVAAELLVGTERETE